MANPVAPPLGPNRAPTPGGHSGSGPVAPPLGPNAKGGSSASPKKSGGIFGSVAHGVGSAFNVVKSVPSALGTIATKGGSELYHSFKDTNETHAVLHPVTAVKQDSVFSKQGRATAAKNFPLTYGAAASLGTTLRQIPDTAVAVAPGGVGFGKSSLGQQVKKEGVLNTGLAKVGDLAILAGGVGLAGEAAGGGRLARISKLGEVADKSIEALHTGETIATADKAARLANDAIRAGDATRAANLDAITKTLAEKEALEAAGAGTKLEKVTAAAKSTSKLGAHVAGAPAEVWVKGAGLLAKGAKLIPGVEEAAAHVGQAIHDSKFASAVRAGKRVNEAASEHITGEQARLNDGIVKSMRAALKAAGKDDTTGAAAILLHSGSADALAKLADLPDEHLAPLLEKHVGPGFTPEALRLALAPTPAVEEAAAHLGEAVASHESHFPKQYGNKADLSEAALANRAHGVEHPLEPLPLAVEKESARLQSPIHKMLRNIEIESEQIRQRNLDRQAGTLSSAAEKQIARDEATAKHLRRQAAKEEARKAQVAKAAEQAKGRVETADNNRIGSIAGRARETMLEQGQLREGLAPRRGSIEGAADRVAKTAAAAEAKGAAAREASFSAKGERVTPKTIRANAAEAIAQDRAAEAQAAADQLRGVPKPKTAGKIQAETNRAAAVANARTAGESTTTERLTGAEAGRQESALQRAQRQLAAHEETAGARAERLRNDAAARTFREDQNRLAALDERKATLTKRLDTTDQQAAESTKAMPKPARAVALQTQGIADDLRALSEKHGDPSLAALADALPKSLEDLKGAGITPKYLPGGTEEAKPGSRRANSAEVTRTKLSAEREATTGTMSSSLKAHGEKLVRESLGMARNEFGAKIAGEISAAHGGVRTVADLVKSHPELRGLKGEELAAALKDIPVEGGGTGFRLWDPNGTGRTLTKDDIAGADHTTAVIPRAYTGKIDRLLKAPEDADLTAGQMAKNATLTGLDRATAGARIAKLLEPGWQVKKTLGDPVMLAAMGVNPLQAAMHFPEALKALKDGNLTPGLGASAEGRIAMEAPATRLGRGARAITNKLFSPFQHADALAREIAYRAKLADGLSPSAAAAEVKRGLGDLQHMTSAEKNVLKRTFTFYPWQKHVATVMLRLPLEHPAGLAQAAHINQIAHPGGNENPSQAEQFTNPFESSGLSMIAENPARGVASVGSQINPVIRAGLVGATGADPARGLGQITAPNRAYGATPQPQVLNPIEFAKYLARLAPPVKTAQDLLNTEPAKGGKLPQRYSTGEPMRGGSKHTGAVKATTLGATTRMQALLQMLGIEPPQPPAKAKKK
jgi:hypothetical protein